MVQTPDYSNAVISSHTAQMTADVIKIESFGHLPTKPGHEDTSKATAAAARSIPPHVLKHQSPKLT